MIGAEVQAIPVMSLPEAITLLEEWAGVSLANTAPELKAQIVNRLGRLPLAVKLAGAQLQKKAPQEWLKTFEARKLKSKRLENVHDSLEQTFGLSLDALDTTARKLYTALVIFREDEPIREAAIARLWEALDSRDVDELQELVDDLAARALLEVVGAELPRAVVLHDLLRDFMGTELGDAQEQTHQRLLEAYRTTQTGEGWHTAPDDGYLYDHLTYHLKATGDYPQLKALFDSDAWLHVRVPQSEYTYDGYITDVMTAWKDFAHPEALRQIEADTELTAFADCVRYALIRTSINSLAANYVPELVARAVETGLWTVKRALSITEKMPDAEQQATLYKLLLATEKLNSIERKTTLTAALAIGNERDRAIALAALAPHLSSEAREQALAQALTAALAMSDFRVSRSGVSSTGSPTYG